MTDSGWSKKTPALGEILVRLLSIKARLDRIEAARQMTAITKTLHLLEE